MNDASSLISPIDVAVCDPDVLWRVEHMNAIKGVNVREFASAADAVVAATPHHTTVVVIGPSSPHDELTAVAALESSAPWIRLVVVDRNDGRDLSPPTGAPPIERVLGYHVDDAEFATAVLEVLARPEAPSDSAGEAVTEPVADGSPVPAESSTATGAESSEPAGTEAPGERDRPVGDVIVVTSAKGGEGASTIALNLAIEIADPTIRVALVDGDPHFGDLALDLGLTPPTTLAGGDQASSDLGPAALMSEDPSGVLLVQLPQPTGAAGSRSDEQEWRTLAEVIALARDQADVVVVDMPIDALLDTEEFHDLGPILVVTSGHTASIKNALLAAERLGITRDAGLVVNEISHHHGSVTADEIARSVGLRLRAHLPYDAALVRAATTPDARLVARRHSRYERAIRALRHDLASREAVAIR